MTSPTSPLTRRRSLGLTVASTLTIGFGGLVLFLVELGVLLQNDCGDTSNSPTCGDAVSGSALLLPGAIVAVLTGIALFFVIRAGLGERLARVVGWPRTAALALAFLPMPIGAILIAIAVAHVPSSSTASYDQNLGLASALVTGIVYAIVWHQLLVWMTRARLRDHS